MISMVENHLTFVILSWRAKNPGEMISGYKINFQQSLGSKIPNAILSFFFKLNYGHRVSGRTTWHTVGRNIYRNFSSTGVQNRESSRHRRPQARWNHRVGQGRFEHSLGASRWQTLLLWRWTFTGMTLETFSSALDMKLNFLSCSWTLLCSLQQLKSISFRMNLNTLWRSTWSSSAPI